MANNYDIVGPGLGISFQPIVQPTLMTCAINRSGGLSPEISYKRYNQGLDLDLQPSLLLVLYPVYSIDLPARHVEQIWSPVHRL